MNKFRIEYYGDSIGTKDNVTRMFVNKQIGLMLTITDQNNQNKFQCIISREEAENLCENIKILLNDSTAKKAGLSVV